MTRSPWVTRSLLGLVLALALALAGACLPDGLAEGSGDDLAEALADFGVWAARVSAVSIGVSRVMWLAGLSSRMPWKEAWRTCPSGVHSAKLTSATNSGLSQCGMPSARMDQRPRLGLLMPSGGSSVSSACMRW